MPQWLTPARALAFSGLLGLFVVGLIALSLLLGAGGGGDDEEEERAAATPTPTATAKPKPTPTPTPTPVPLTPEQRAQREAAADQVRAQGYEPVSLKAYHPDQTLRVLLGEQEASAAAGTPAGRRAFFFAGATYIGTDAEGPSAKLRTVSQSPNTVTLEYGLSTGEKRKVRFKWDGTSLVPQSPVPTATERQAAPGT